MNRTAFFSAIRRTPFPGRLTQGQVDGVTAILDGWQRRFPKGDSRWLAYALATAFHETGRTMQPIRERGFGAGRPYGATDTVTGHVFAGRGLVQLTWKDNYRRASHLVDRDLVNNPDAALEMDVSVDILLLGMARGLFTGKRFADYFNATLEAWVRARRIVNGLDRAHDIADYGRAFYAALRAAR